jgi:hypothetical protein
MPLRRLTLLLLLSLTFLAPACRPQGLLPDPCAQGGPIPISPDAAQRFERKMWEVVRSPDPQFSLEISSEEVTSYLTLRALGIPLADPQVRFVEGRVCLSGTFIGLDSMQMNLSVVAAAEMEEGQVRVKIERAILGSIPLPTRLLSRVINETLQDAQVQFTITRLEIHQDRLIVEGTRS